MTGLLPQRLISLAPAFVSICSAIFCSFLIAKRKLVFRTIVVIIVFFTLFTAFIAPWSISYVPLYIYDSSIRMEDVGIHNPLYPFLGSFINKRCDLDYYFLSDDPELMYVILPPSKYHLIKTLYYKSSIDLYGQSNTYIVELINLGLQARPLYDTLEITSLSETQEVKDLINSKYNVVLDSYHFKLYISINST